jgi:hypothetical protein
MPERDEASALKQIGIFLYNVRGKWEKNTRSIFWEVERQEVVLMYV